MKFGDLYQKQVQVARVYGIPVRIDYRWFAVFAVSVWLIATNFERGVRFVRVDPLTAWAVGAFTTVALFLCVFGHELAHAVIARLEGIETVEIVLHPFGGLARLRGEPQSAKAELNIAIAGPAASFLFGLLALAVTWIAKTSEYYVAAAAFFLIGSFNLLLAVFNLLPGYPLDGGRVLRALLWRRTGDFKEATRIASISGQLIAWTLVVLGVWLAVLRGDLLSGLWTVLVGLFLRSAAANVVKESGVGKRATVNDAMGAPLSIEPDVLVSHFVDQILPLHRQTAVPVARERRLHGILMLEDLKKLPRERWRVTRAGEVMRPVNPQLFVEDGTTLEHAESLMRSNGTGALAVINGVGELVGFLQPGKLKRNRT